MAQASRGQKVPPPPQPATAVPLRRQAPGESPVQSAPKAQPGQGKSAVGIVADDGEGEESMALSEIMDEEQKQRKKSRLLTGRKANMRQRMTEEVSSEAGVDVMYAEEVKFWRRCLEELSIDGHKRSPERVVPEGCPLEEEHIHWQLKVESLSRPTPGGSSIINHVPKKGSTPDQEMAYWRQQMAQYCRPTDELIACREGVRERYARRRNFWSLRQDLDHMDWPALLSSKRSDSSCRSKSEKPITRASRSSYGGRSNKMVKASREATLQPQVASPVQAMSPAKQGIKTGEKKWREVRSILVREKKVEG